MVGWQGSEVTQFKKNLGETQAPVPEDKTKWEGLFLVSGWVYVPLIFSRIKVLLNKDPQLI
jgi:hypothetical protein